MVRLIPHDLIMSVLFLLLLFLRACCRELRGCSTPYGTVSGVRSLMVCVVSPRTECAVGSHRWKVIFYTSIQSPFQRERSQQYSHAWMLSFSIKTFFSYRFLKTPSTPYSLGCRLTNRSQAHSLNPGTDQCYRYETRTLICWQKSESAVGITVTFVVDDFPRLWERNILTDPLRLVT